VYASEQNMSAPLLEIAANSLASALARRTAAPIGRAVREPRRGRLHAVLRLPSRRTRDCVRLPLYVLIRPRPGDFYYDEFERDVMLRDIEACARWVRRRSDRRARCRRSCRHGHLP
jgi:copper homeostasis protein